MLIAMIMAPLFLLITFIIGLLPNLSATTPSFGGVFSVIGYGCAIIGGDFFALVIGNIVFWMTAHMAWAIIEWLYKKIPGVS